MKIINRTVSLFLFFTIGLSGCNSDSKDIEVLIEKLKTAGSVQSANIAIELRKYPSESLEPTIPYLMNMLADSTVMDLMSDYGFFSQMMYDGYTSPGLEAAKTISGIGAPALPKLIKALSSPSAHTRKNAVFALGSIGDPRSIKPIINLINIDTNSVIIVTALHSLEKFKSDQSVYKTLILALNNKNEGVRSAALEVLGAQEAKQAENFIIIALKDNKASVRNSAVKTLGLLKSNKAEPYLIAALKDSDYMVRASAIESLEAIGSKNATDNLIYVVLNDNEEESNRISAIATINDVKAVDPLLIILNDKRLVNLHKPAIWALGRIGDKRAIATLVELLNNKEFDFDIRIALSNITGKSKNINWSKWWEKNQHTFSNN
ncbi:MAG: HEAT repeat domain-containing protein [Bacteroidales bacterium]|nr:HEAT repeat domain-containing protein [Bacteroidales bacterium]